MIATMSSTANEDYLNNINDSSLLCELILRIALSQFKCLVDKKQKPLTLMLEVVAKML